MLYFLLIFVVEYNIVEIRDYQRVAIFINDLLAFGLHSGVRIT